MSGNDLSNVLDDLVSVFLATKDKKALKAFLLQLLSTSEAVMLARRWEIAQMLASGETYYAIREKLGVGMSTITSVDHWLSDAIGDYKKILEKEMLANKEIKLEYMDVADTMTSIRHRYALPFLLVNMLIDGIEKDRRKEPSK